MKILIRWIASAAVLLVGAISMVFFIKDLISGEDSQKKAFDAYLSPKAEVLPKSEQIQVTQSSRQPQLPDRFRENYTIELSNNRYLLSLKSKHGFSDGAPGFNPQEKTQVEKRAKDLVVALEGSLGVSAASIKIAGIQLGKYSAQVFYQQTMDGLEIAPYGNLSLDLSKDGTLGRLDSDLLKPVQISNQQKLSPLEVKTRHGLKSEPRRLLWATRPNADIGPVPLLRSYEFHEEGFQIVVNAENGEIIYKRDRRIR